MGEQYSSTREKIVPVILSGGSGSRLWPVSRLEHPKPFIKLDDGESLLQKTYKRALNVQNLAEVMTVSNREFFFKTKDEYKEIDEKLENKTKKSYILEPFGRNTAPAIALAALDAVANYGADAILVIMPSDHLIKDENAFNDVLIEAIKFASDDKLVTFGITPSEPKTGFGYIEFKGNDVIRFVEKPSLEKAEEYVKSGNFLWNSGMFAFKAGVILAEMHKNCPEIVANCKKCKNASSIIQSDAERWTELEGDEFKKVEDISIDYAVMEKSDNVAIVPCEIGWSDVGSWNDFGDLMQVDENGNRLEGQVMLKDVRNCTVKANGRLVAGVNLENLFVVDTKDALLISSKDSVQDVKFIYNKLKETGHEAHKIHTTAYRPWGSYTILEEAEGVKVKRIEVKPGAALSLQLHKHRSEHWVVVKGKALVVNGDREIELDENQSTFIPLGNKHRLTNVGDEILVLIEVQYGDYLGEDDIVRLEDVYGRVDAVDTDKVGNKLTAANDIERRKDSPDASYAS